MRPTILYVKCKKHEEGCPWRVRAFLLTSKLLWRITKRGSPHTCLNVALSQDHPKLSSKFVAPCFLGKFVNVTYFVSYYIFLHTHDNIFKFFKNGARGYLANMVITFRTRKLGGPKKKPLLVYLVTGTNHIRRCPSDWNT